jgi:hypothetical protein
MALSTGASEMFERNCEAEFNAAMDAADRAELLDNEWDEITEQEAAAWQTIADCADELGVS